MLQDVFAVPSLVENFVRERVSGGFQEEPLLMHLSSCHFIHLLNYSGTLLLVHSPFNRLSEYTGDDAPRLYLGQWQEKRCKGLRGVKKKIKVIIRAHSNAVTALSHCVLWTLLRERVSGVLLWEGASLMKGTMRRLAVLARRLKLRPGFNCPKQGQM